VSRIFDALRHAEQRRAARRGDDEPRPFRLVTVASNKGGVGKTTTALNLAVYLRALREQLPMLVLSLDDQPMIERMFALDGEASGDDLAAALRRGHLRGALRMGQYGVGYVRSSRDLPELKRELRGVAELDAALRATGLEGLVVVDTKSDLEILTQNAIWASDLCLVVVKDQASLREADRLFDLLAAWGRPRERARVVLSLVDLRVKYTDPGRPDVLALLVSQIRERGYPLCATFLSRSPKVEALYTNPDGRAQSILHGAPGSVVHAQMASLAEDVLGILDGAPAVRPEPAAQRERVSREGVLRAKRTLLGHTPGE
jgi:cellulose biosynthesis protein BcsQ